jgi:transcriptional regulator with GAF, ATPase, and Fis domain
MGGQRPTRVRTVQELQAEERANVLLALETAGWRVSGDKGAARLLGLKPSTLNSRMRALGIQRPRT